MISIVFVYLRLNQFLSHQTDTNFDQSSMQTTRGEVFHAVVIEQSVIFFSSHRYHYAYIPTVYKSEMRVGFVQALF